jgi:SAM-dependent methyltransferase
MSSGLESATNYHRWNYEWIAPYVSGRILDVGGGTGNHLAFLGEADVTSIDLSSECVAELRERHKHRRHWSFEVGDITRDDLVDRLGPSKFDTVLSCNVFEHIADDGRAFHNACRLLRPGGKLVLLLPAHSWLYGSMDRLAGHYRRYSKRYASERLAEAGLKEEALRYVNLVGAIGWYVNNRVMRHSDLSSGTINRQIKIFDRLLIPALSQIEGDRGMPFGQSLLCVGTKPS